MLQVLTWLAVFISSASFSQTLKVDSLLKVIQAKSSDTTRMNTLNHLGLILSNTKPDTSLILHRAALEIALKTRDERGEYESEFGLGKASEELQLEGLHHYQKALAIADRIAAAAESGSSGWKLALRLQYDVQHKLENFYYRNGEYTAAHDYCSRNLRIAESLGAPKLIAEALMQLANTYSIRGLYTESLKYYFAALKHAEAAKDSKMCGILYGNIGIVYIDIPDFEKALDYCQRCLKSVKENGDRFGVALVTGNIGLIYEMKGEYQAALRYFLEAQELRKELNDRVGTAITYGNIANAYLYLREFNKALENYQKALRLSEELGDTEGVARTLGNLGSYYIDVKDYTQAEIHLKRSLEMQRQMNNWYGIMCVEKLISSLDSARGDYRSSFEHYKLYVIAADSLVNEENTRKQTQLEMQFEFDKQQLADSVRVAEERKIRVAELKEEKNKRNALYGGLGLLLVFTLFMYNRFRITQRQRSVIESQKLLVEEQKKIVDQKNKDIMDSIHYARRIQQSLLPKERYIARILGKK